MRKSRVLGPVLSAVGVSLAAAAALPGNAVAATPEYGFVSYDADQHLLTYRGTSAVNTVSLTISGDNEWYQIYDRTVGTIAGEGCGYFDLHGAIAVRCGGANRENRLRVDFTLGAGHDRLETEIALDGPVRGEEGNDTWKPDEDLYDGLSSSLEFYGDEGFDWVDYSAYRGRVDVSLDGIPNDGRPGDDDDIAKSVDGIRGTAYNDVLKGDDGQNIIKAGPGVDIVRGYGAADIIDIRDGDVDKLIDCGFGDDSLTRDPADPRGTACEHVD